MMDDLNGNDLFSYSHVDVLLTQLRQMKEGYRFASHCAQINLSLPHGEIP